MPWTMQDPPGPAKNWPEAKKRACVRAANAALAGGKSEQDAIYACIGAAKNVEASSWRAVLDSYEAMAVGPGGSAEGGRKSPPAGYPTSRSEYCDPTNWKWPTDTAARCKAAISYYNQPGQQGKGGYSAQEWATIGRCIARRASAKLGVKYMLKDGKVERTEDHDGQRVIDLFKADKVLAGEPVRLLPLLETGYYRGGQLRPPVTMEVLQAMLANWQARSSSGLYQTSLPLNVEHDERGGKIGAIADLVLGDDGLYAVFELTDKGQQLLADGAFDYLSPEVIWDVEDSQTGQVVGPAVVGAAVTNYPFFGDATAMFSREAGAHFKTHPPDEQEGGLSENQLFSVVKRAIQAVLGESPQNRQTEVESMTEPKKGEGGGPAQSDQVPEEYARRMEEMEGQISEFNRMLKERDQQIETQQSVIDKQSERIDDLSQSRLRERFARQVEGFAHIGADSEQLVDELLWLNEADDTKEKVHFAYWGQVLATVEQALSKSASFQEAGQPGHRTGGSAYNRLTALVLEEAGRRNMVVTEGDANFSKLAAEVAAAHPDLYAEHIAQVRNQ